MLWWTELQKALIAIDSFEDLFSGNLSRWTVNSSKLSGWGMCVKKIINFIILSVVVEYYLQKFDSHR